MMAIQIATLNVADCKRVESRPSVCQKLEDFTAFAIFPSMIHLKEMHKNSDGNTDSLCLLVDGRQKYESYAQRKG